MAKRVIASLLVLLMLPVALWGLSKLVGPSRAEREALALMSESPQLTGRNAFADMWLADYPVPPERREEVLAADVAKYAAAWQAIRTQAGTTVPR